MAPAQQSRVLRCCSCHLFQAHQVKKSLKWTCKACGEKQSFVRVSSDQPRFAQPASLSLTVQPRERLHPGLLLPGTAGVEQGLDSLCPSLGCSASVP
ncbi:hypothetical protein U0070_013140 [Myodes glareolus]|uniref:MRN complex-interacting protein N-terminal domain-containing protein n=1 Tax=Myodes glareolus TaxID=447135 RepID=A0AAW0HFP7_MYOGA